MSSQHAWPTAEVLSSERLQLWPVREDDADDVAAALDDPRLHEFIGGEPASAADLRRRFGYLVVGHSPDGSEGWLNWVVRDLASGAVVGTAQATLYRRASGLVADIAWVVGTTWQGQGLAKEAATALTAWLWTRDVTEIGAFIHPDHAASAGVARGVGMVPTDTVVDGEIRWVLPRS